MILVITRLVSAICNRIAAGVTFLSNNEETSSLKDLHSCPPKIESN